MRKELELPEFWLPIDSRLVKFLRGGQELISNVKTQMSNQIPTPKCQQIEIPLTIK
jgi:hypothetical protein